MKNLTKPLGVKGKSKSKKKPVEAGAWSKRLLALPYVTAAIFMLFGIAVVAAMWIAVIDDPVGGEPIVTVRIIEPKFDNESRQINVVEVEKIEQEVDDEPVTLTELEPAEGDGLLPVETDEILIFDPSKAAAASNVIELSKVADKALVEKSRHGFVPKIGANGEKPLVAYSRPAGLTGTRKSRIAIIIGGLGLNNRTTQRSLADLPPQVTLAFAPYADGLFDWMTRARSRGHELLLQVPLEPFDYPNNDPGPKTLLVDADWTENKDKLLWLMSRMTNYVGIVNYMGARFSASPDAMRPLMREIQKRGLLYVDDGSTPLSRAGEVAGETNVAYQQSSLVLDSLLNADEIDARLLELESLAREKGVAVGIASAFPVSIERLKRWAKDAEKRGVSLVPVSATLDKSSF